MTTKVKILDCTLRDGGYVNDWQFGDDNAKNICRLIGLTGIDYFEVGFIKLCDYVKDKIQFSEMSQITNLFRPTKQKLSLIVEVGYGYPVSAFPSRSEKTVDLVRVIMWKRMLKEGLEYCRQLKQKGYEVSVQATRTEQYSLEEFADVCKMFSEINPDALYIVDTFGLLTKEKLMEYATIADKNLATGIRLGYHAHNNMQQAFSNAVAFMEHQWQHDLMLDASVYGMGRGAGNLCLELLLQYLNEMKGEKHDVAPLYEIMDKYLMPFYEKSPWGYSMPYQLSAINGRNPSYVGFMQSKGLTIEQMAKVYQMMREQGVGITYDEELCNKLIKTI